MGAGPSRASSPSDATTIRASSRSDATTMPVCIECCRQPCCMNMPQSTLSLGESTALARAEFQAKLGELNSYKTFAIGALYAARAVVQVSTDPTLTTSVNYSRCNDLLAEFFGGPQNLALTDDQKRDLAQNIKKMLQQTKCNETQVKFQDEDPQGNPPDRCYAYTYGNVVGQKRVLYAGNLWHAQPIYERGLTFLHEISHACLRTKDYKDDVNYSEARCKQISWEKASTCAVNYEIFCHRAFCMILDGEMMSIAPELRTCANYDNSTSSLRHMPGQMTKGSKFLIQITGDKYGEKSQGGARLNFHQISQAASVDERDGDNFKISMQGNGFYDHPASQKTFKTTKSGIDGSGKYFTFTPAPKYFTINDGVNEFYVKMLSKDVGVGLVHCGGRGGRSFVAYTRNAVAVDGKVTGGYDWLHQ